MQTPINKSPKIETEAKFTVPSLEIFSELQKITRLGNFQIRGTGTKTLTDRYVDTADRRLFKAGFACRIRYIENRQILALKSLAPADGAVHRRQEFEAEVNGEQPQSWGDSPAKNLLLQIIGASSLETLFSIYQVRHKHDVLRREEALIEFSLDKVAHRSPDQVDYLELEAELIGSGEEADLALFIEPLLARWPLQPETQSKFERALAYHQQQV